MPGFEAPSGRTSTDGPKVVALDIDGTLINWDLGGVEGGAVRPAVREAVRRAYDAGAHIVLASGRSPHGMTIIADEIGIPDATDERLWVVASNGSVILRYPPAEVVHEELFDARPAVEAILAAHPQVLVAVEERGVGYRLNDHFPPGELNGDMIITPVDELVAQPVSRVIIRDPQADRADFTEMVLKLGLYEISYVVGFSAWLDLAAPGVSKASGLAYVVERLGLEAKDVLAIGDGSNDVEMLTWAGRGVAMGNAPDAVKEVADGVTLDVTDDGAAVELSKWF
jgi:hydroxymethylpyrimidine pyrophosphatase-like HAD family hydrolase